MTVAAAIKKPAKALMSAFPLLDVLSRRFVWRRVYPRLFFHEPEMRFFYGLPKGSVDVAVDIGAAMGTYCWILGRSARRIFAFEPGRRHNKYLSMATFLTNVEVIRAAVGAKPGKVKLFTPGKEANDQFYASVSPENPVTQSATSSYDEVEQVSLDDFLGRRLSEGRHVDIIKVDVEGYEMEAFRGATETLKRFAPLVICEIEARHNSAYREVFILFRSLGYEVYVYRDGTFEPFAHEAIEPFQKPEDLERRLHGSTAEHGSYVNNFIFQHPDSRVKVHA